MAWLAQEVIDKVREDLDIDEDELVPNSQIYTFINSAVRMMVAEMLKLGVEDKYYETNAKMSIVASQEEYSIPSAVYVTKLYKIIHERPGTREIYPVKRLRGMYEYEKYHEENQTPVTSRPQYNYKLMNRAGTPSFLLVPTPQESETNALTLWYARKPVKVVDGSTIVDVPEEFIDFIIDYVKVECLRKDLGNPLLPDLQDSLKQSRALLIDTLTDQTQDNDNEIEADLSFYNDMES